MSFKMLWQPSLIESFGIFGKHPSISIVWALIFWEDGRRSIAFLIKAGTCALLLIVKCSPGILAVTKDQALPVRWNNLRIGCFVWGAIGLAFIHEVTLLTGSVIFLAFKSRYGVLKCLSVRFTGGIVRVCVSGSPLCFITVGILAIRRARGRLLFHSYPTPNLLS